MEDPRLSRMYAKLFAGTLARRRRRAWRWAQENRASLLAVFAVMLLVILAVGYTAHLHGRFRRLKTELKAMGNAPVVLPPMPGGQEAVVMQRTLLAEGTTPEFLSATLLPGRGLNILQIMLSVPGRGSVPLLAAASLEDAARLMTGEQTDSNGALSLQLGSPVEAPWAGTLVSSKPENSSEVTSLWRGRTLTTPATAREGSVTLGEGGLLLKTEADSVKQNILPDGGTVQGSFVASNFGGRWPSSTSVSVTALLSSRAFDLKLVARNEGTEPVPVGLGWRPQILLPGGTRNGVRLRLPAEEYEEMKDGKATGRLPGVAGTALDFTDRSGKPLRDVDLDTTFVDLRSGFLDNGPVLEIRDAHSGIGIRMTAMSPQIHAVHLRSLANENKVIVGFQTNYDDPFCHAFSTQDPPSIHVLQPGQTLQWRVRMELFAVKDDPRPRF